MKLTPLNEERQRLSRMRIDLQNMTANLPQLEEQIAHMKRRIDALPNEIVIQERKVKYLETGGRKAHREAKADRQVMLIRERIQKLNRKLEEAEEDTIVVHTRTEGNYHHFDVVRGKDAAAGAYTGYQVSDVFRGHLVPGKKYRAKFIPSLPYSLWHITAEA